MIYPDPNNQIRLNSSVFPVVIQSCLTFHDISILQLSFWMESNELIFASMSEQMYQTNWNLIFVSFLCASNDDVCFVWNVSTFGFHWIQLILLGIIFSSLCYLRVAPCCMAVLLTREYYDFLSSWCQFYKKTSVSMTARWTNKLNLDKKIVIRREEDHRILLCH